MKRLTTFLALCALAATLSAQPYKDRSLPPQERAQDLVSRMTLEEKASVAMHHAAAIPALEVKAYNWWSEALHGVARNGSATVFPQPAAATASTRTSTLIRDSSSPS